MIAPRILLLAPHPDDEVVGACTAIRRARAQGASVQAAFLTTGLPAPDRLWPWNRKRHAAMLSRRREEAGRVAGELQLETYSFSTSASRTAKDRLAGYWKLIDLLLTKLRSDAIWVPAYEGGHPDHDAANFVAGQFRERAAVWEFSEYNFSGGKVRSNEFVTETGDEIEIRLTEDEKQFKRRMLRLYASERTNLRHIHCDREVFRPLAAYDYAKPPHEGKLFYQRFQWVPFHPRVNHVRPDQVLRAFREFRSRS